MAIASVFRSRVLSGPFQLLRALSRPALTALAVGLAAVVSGILTYLNISGFAPYESPPATLVVLFVVDFALVLALGVLIAWRLTRLWTERKSGAAGSRMHVRLVGMFSAIAVIPAILVAIFAAVSLNLGVEAWFSERVQTALANSVSVADAYVEEHKQVIRADISPWRTTSIAPDRFCRPIRSASSTFWRPKPRSARCPAVYVIDFDRTDAGERQARVDARPRSR